MAFKFKKKYPLELIQWVDHCSYEISKWRDLNEIAELDPLYINSVGWVIYEDKKKVVIVSTANKKSGNAVGEMIIVKSCITKRWKLKDYTTP